MAADTIVNLASIPILAGLVGALWILRHDIATVLEAKTIEIQRRVEREDQKAWVEGYEQGYEDAATETDEQLGGER